MHTNFKLNFYHSFGFEVFQDNDTPRVEILINDTPVFDETFSANTLHKRNSQFHHDYLDREKNCIEFRFTGNEESANRYVRVKNITVNDTYINVLQNYWNPDINQEWFDSLGEAEQFEIKRRIYGNNNAVFGWYGTWKYYFNSGVDFSSKYKGCTNDLDNVIGMRPVWITLSKNTVTKPWHGTLDD